jgi:hypothetical protein
MKAEYKPDIMPFVPVSTRHETAFTKSAVAVTALEIKEHVTSHTSNLIFHMK